MKMFSSKPPAPRKVFGGKDHKSPGDPVGVLHRRVGVNRSDQTADEGQVVNEELPGQEAAEVREVAARGLMAAVFVHQVTTVSSNLIVFSDNFGAMWQDISSK